VIDQTVKTYIHTPSADTFEGDIVETSVNSRLDDENTPLLSNYIGCLQVHVLKITSSQLQVPFCPSVL